jgi:hypothetical protein
MNSRGQAFSTFKLLIAAIVAIAILAILIPILTGLIIPGNEIQTVTKQLVQNQRVSPGELATSNDVIFKEGSSLAPSALSENTGMTADQVCLHLGTFAGNNVFNLQGKTIMNSGQDRTIRVSVMCHRSNQLLEALNELELLSEEIEFDGEAGSCDCELDSDTDSQMCCAVILRHA